MADMPYKQVGEANLGLRWRRSVDTSYMDFDNLVVSAMKLEVEWACPFKPTISSSPLQGVFIGHSSEQDTYSYSSSTFGDNCE
jgi:hypothetical protein